MGELELRRSAGLEQLGEQQERELVALARHAAAELLARGKTSQLIVYQSTFARAYVLRGEWVAECPRDCGNVELITGKASRHRGRAGTRGERYTQFACTYCGATSDIDWPGEYEDITAVLDQRPIPHTRNWYPPGHKVAVAYGIPDGQTIADLIGENIEHGIGAR